MFRKMILAGLIATATLGATNLTSNTASAQPPLIHQHGHHDHRDQVRYQVFVRHHGHWDLVRTFRDRDDAYRAAWALERRGFDAKVERARRW